MSFALSTSWNAFRYTNGNKLIFEIKEAGFEKVELSFNLTASMVEEIYELVRNKFITVVSLHNYCPIPNGMKREAALPDCYALSSTNEEARALAVKYTKRTIETAKKLNAQTVVLHTGRVEIPDRTRDLINLYEKALQQSKNFKDIKDDVIKKRDNSSKDFFENTLKSLEELNKFAVKTGILLGIENRFYYREIPNFEEIGKILAYFKNSNIFYWHDTGHAQVMENLGITPHKDFLNAYGDRIIGFHLHNISGCHDHKPPAKGELDFKFLKPYIKSNTIKVIEAHYPATANELQESRIFLKKALNE